MKEFDLEKALAGEPVKLRDGTKAIIIGKFLPEHCYTETRPVVGYVLNVEGKIAYILNWFFNGSYKNEGEYKFDIVGMWEEPRQRVKLDLPCPLKKWQPNCYFIDEFLMPQKTTAKQENTLTKVFEEVSYYFATKEDAEEWINAIKQSKR